MKTLVFTLGVLTGLAFHHLPARGAIRAAFARGDNSTWPDQQIGPRFRKWENGVETSGDRPA